MPAAVAIPLIIGAAGAGAQVYGAKKASDASKKAAGQQAASADKAQGFNERVYNDQRALMQPYVQGGQDSFARLMANHWGTPLPQGMQPSGGTSAMLGRAAQMNTPGAPPVPPQGTLAQAQQQGAPAPAQPPQGGGQMVRVKAPTGEMAMLPAGSPQLQKALQAGAQVLQ